MRFFKKYGKFILTGGAAGLLNGLFGAGGGMALVPMLYHDGLPAQKAHATSIAVILPLSLVSGIFYLSLGRLTLGDALPFLPLGLAGAAVGGWLLPKVKTVWLHRLFGLLALYAGARLLFFT